MTLVKVFLICLYPRLSALLSAADVLIRYLRSDLQFTSGAPIIPETFPTASFLISSSSCIPQSKNHP
jgi:hypothetical protein